MTPAGGQRAAGLKIGDKTPEELKITAELEECIKKELPDKDHVLFKRVKSSW